MSSVKIFRGSSHFLQLKGLENDINLWLFNEAGVEMTGITMAAAVNDELFVIVSYKKRKEGKE